MKKLAIGIMSGTSLDGIDVSLCEVEGFGVNLKLNELYSNTYKYQDTVLEKIKKAINDSLSIEGICSLNVELAYEYARCVNSLLSECNKRSEEISFVASHGQTIYHISEATETLYQSSLQLGDGSVLANVLGINVVSNFRQADIAKKGQGAPLVPYADYVLFGKLDKTIVLQNIGGISNGTVLKKGCKKDDVLAFDNGPGNMMIDYACKLLFNKGYDQSGEIASKGDLITSLFDEVNQLPYFDIIPPKSTGRELFGDTYIEYLLEKYKAFKKEDIITTLTHITAYNIVKSYERFVDVEVDEIVVSGGGVHNKTMLDLIDFYSRRRIVKSVSEYGINPDYKEAIAFVILGNETIERQPSNIKSATGAKEDVILGQVAYV